MTDQLIPDGTYRVRGPGGVLTANRGPGVSIWEGDGDPGQTWVVAFDSGTYTVLSAASGLYLGTDDDSDAPAMTVRGTQQPYPWSLSTGEDDDETTYILTSAAGLVLSMSLLRIFPPLVAILPPRGYTVEWAFDPA